jgi:hypothetical protein
MGFEDVEDRLVEALRTCWRHADRERGWQQLRSAWPEISRDVLAGDYDARGGDGTSSDVVIRPAAMTRQDVAEMEEAFGWLDGIDPIDRKVIGLAINQLARGRREVPWRSLLPAMGLTRGVEGLRKRYSRAITAICHRANGRNTGADVSSRSK